MGVYEEAARALADARHAIAVTGAGISVESGIPDFRSPGGIWAEYPPEEYATITAFLSNPEEVWRFWRSLARQCADVKPNPGHEALAQLEGMGRLEAVITQNVDNLHQDAGSRNVIEYHGNGRRLRCLACDSTSPFDAAAPGEDVPHCACGGMMKPDVVLFGEGIPEEALYATQDLLEQADLVLVVGASAQVYPAAAIPYDAKQRGAAIIECNTQPTDFTASVTDHFLEGPSGQTLPRLLAALRRL